MSHDSGAGWGLKELGRTCALAGTAIGLCLVVVLVGTLISLGWTAGWLVTVAIVVAVLGTAVAVLAGLLTRQTARR